MARFQQLVAIVPQFLLGHILLAPTTPAFKLPDRCPVFFDKQRPCDPITPASFLPPSIDIGTKPRPDRIADDSVFADLLSALNATQTIFFAPWLGTWPEAIDWTAAVIGTHISGATRSISEDLAALNSRHDSVTAWKLASNLIDDYFAQTIAFYFGQNAVALRNEAYDDMLWVVLGWIEAIKFVDAHNDLHYAITSSDPSGAAPDVFGRYAEIPAQPYHGNVWISTFAHRARIFWDLASHGWDTKLCDGGMLWNPRLLPYKNAITNELFIAASISMYLYFPGDDSQSSFSNRCDRFNPNDPDPQTYSGSRDPRYLKAAVESYRWLRNSNMTNARGLFVDGFHISGYLDKQNNNTRCDARDETVYSYNQGVILTGQRGLWDVTGASSYLADGHDLIQKVIRATGYSLRSDSPLDQPEHFRAGALPRWHGLGRLGVMEEIVDASGTGSQDSQTFKGIFFHHLTAFCAPLEPPAPASGLRIHGRAFAAVRRSHARACKSYSGWLEHNARAALATRDAAGRFGQWWTAGLLRADWTGPWPTRNTDGIDDTDNASDHRNRGVPADTMWRDELLAQAPHTGFSRDRQVPLHEGVEAPSEETGRGRTRVKDPNDRGRGRTVESHSSGLGLLRAYWKISRIP